MEEEKELIKIVFESNSLAEVLRKQGKAISGDAISLLKHKLKEYNIDYERFFCK